MLALAPFALIGCADETPPPVTTTTVTREVTTTGPVVATEPVASDVYVAEAPPAVRVEADRHARSGLYLDAGLLALVRSRLRLGFRLMGEAASSRCGVGTRALGASAPRLGLDFRSLAISLTV